MPDDCYLGHPVYFITAWDEDVYSGTADNPTLKKYLNSQARAVMQDTLGLVQPKDMVFLIDVARERKLRESREVRTYLRQSCFHGRGPSCVDDHDQLKSIYGFKVLVLSPVSV